MKKIGAVLLAVFLFCAGFTCYASEADNSSRQTSIDVYAKTVNGDVVCETAPVSDGKAQIDLDGGGMIAAVGAPDRAYILKVVSVPESEADAWEWIRSCLDGDITIYAIYDIYFEDADGNRINVDGVEITLTAGGDDRDIYSVAVSGQSCLLDSVSENGKIIFTADGSHYYVVTEGMVGTRPGESDSGSSLTEDETVNGSGTADRTDKSETGRSGSEETAASVQTGDNIIPQLFTLLFLMFISAGLAITVKRKM